jgi:hypothetical protein
MMANCAGFPPTEAEKAEAIKRNAEQRAAHEKRLAERKETAKP